MYTKKLRNEASTSIGDNQQNGRVASSKVLSLHRNTEEQKATIRTNIARTLEKSQRFITKQMLNQEKDNLKMVGK